MYDEGFLLGEVEVEDDAASACPLQQAGRHLLGVGGRVHVGRHTLHGI